MMSFITLEQLPFVGMSYEFVGEKEGAPFSAYIVNARPGQGPPLHTHPYVEVAITLEAALSSFQRTHRIRFVNAGDTLLRQIDIHASPRFIQTNL